jgi:flagellar hook-associated protein 2
MADSAFRAGGLASGLDSNLIIDKLIELESRPIDLMKQRQSAMKSQISAIADIKSKLSDLASIAKTLGTSGSVATKVSSTQTGFDVVTGAGAVAGRHTVQVTRLAAAAAARSQGFTSSTAPVQGGTLAFTVQGKDYNITIADGAELADVAFQIRQTGAPISATVVSDGTQSYLSLISNVTGNPKTGVALAFTETSTGVLGQPLKHPDQVAHPFIFQEAIDAELTVDGLTGIVRSSNSVGDIIPGVTLNLKALTATEETLVIGNDVEGTKTNIQKFVDSYNTVFKLIQTQLASTPGSDRATSLSGDPSIRSLQAALQGLLTKNTLTSAINDFSGNIRSLADIGVKTARDGSITLDTKVLTTALNNDADAVNELFSRATTGLATVTDTTINRYNNFVDGVLATRTKGLQASVTKMDDQIAKMQMRVEMKRTELINQFTAMEKIVSSLKSTGNFLTQMSAQGGK